jgi:hypothetical protein
MPFRLFPHKGQTDQLIEENTWHKSRPMERAHLTLSLIQSYNIHKNPSLHLSREPLVSRLRQTALGAAFSFSNKSYFVC